MKTKILKIQILSALMLILFIANISNAQDNKNLLTKANIESIINDAYNKYKDVTDGKNADYIPALAEVDSKVFGIALVTADGQVFTKGDLDTKVSIQSVSKVFTLALVIEEKGAQIIQDSVGVDATGQVFNSIVAVEQMRGKEINPLVNPGAIATTSMVEGDTYDAKWNKILQIHSDFAGRQLDVNEPVYKSEAETNQRNQAIAHLLYAYGRMYADPVMSTDIYTKQCAINVNAKDLGMMAATLSNGGVNPVTKKKVVSPQTVEHVLPVMVTAGLYDDSGIWVYNAGNPAKSGVGGGLICVVPGEFGIAVISPPLDAAGNSVKGQLVIKYVIDQLKANSYLINPK
jgi:glutaminase